MTERGFPVEWLAEPAAKRLEHFKRMAVAHPILKEVDAQLRHTIAEPGGTTTVLVFGPTGVGKTTMLLRVAQQLTKELASTLEDNPGRIPIASFVATAPDASHFSWKDYYLNALWSLDEPLVNKKLDYSEPGVFFQRKGPMRIAARAAGTDLRHALVSALRYRQVAALFVDEAQHLTKIASGRKLKDQMDCIKSLSDQAKTLHVLFGTYELLACRNQSAQLGRRSIDIHFRRYRSDREQDLATFRNVIWNLQRALPLEEEPDLDRHWEYLYERSIGCVGILKDWLTEALTEALNAKALTVTLDHLERNAPSISRCVKMAQEAVEGERRLMEDEGSRPKLLSLLGIERPLAPPEARERIATPAEPSAPPSTQPKRGRVGQRHPKRDAIGVNNRAS